MFGKRRGHLMKRIFVWLGGALLLFLLVWVVYTQGPLAPSLVQITEIQVGDLQPQVFGIGTVEAQALYTIGPTQAGRLSEVYVDQGDKVTIGQMLAKMEPIDLPDRINSAASAKQRAKSMVDVAEMQLQEIQSKRDLAQKKLQRYQQLYSEAVISQQALDEAESDLEVIQAALASASFSIQAAKSDAERTASDYQALLKQGENLVLISRINGVVVSREMEVGNTVSAGQAVFKITDMSQIWVKTRIDQARADGITVGQKANIAVRSNPNKTFRGTVSRVDMQSDSVTEECTVNIAFDAATNGLSLGDLAEVTIDLSQLANASYLPTVTVKTINHQTGVWLVEAEKVLFKPVAIGVSTLAGQTQILNGLPENSRVVVASPVELKEGMKVRVEDSV